MEFQNKFLIISSSTFNQDTEEENIYYHCRYCTSEYTRRYRERGIDQIRTVKNKIDNPTGKMPDEFAPNFLTANFDQVFKRESFIGVAPAWTFEHAKAILRAGAFLFLLQIF